MEELLKAIKAENLDERHAAVEKMAERARKSEEAAAQIISALREADMNGKWYLGRALLKTGPSVIPALIKEAETEPQADVLRYYGAVLASFGKESVAPLVGLFSSENAAARGMAGAALEKIGEPALESLLDAAKSDNQTVKICAGIVLMKLGVYSY
jgi:HEAT repeat protein